MDNNTNVIFNFNPDSDLSNWYIVDDVVMGGRSDGKFELNEEGHGLFYGDVSLENYGGFSSVQYRFDEKSVSDYTMIKLRIKGDGKSYQFRTKTKRFDPHSYILEFNTKKDWETIVIPLSEMYPSFRGRKLDMPNYPAESLEQISILIANKKAESFQLEIDWIKFD